MLSESSVNDFFKELRVKIEILATNCLRFFMSGISVSEGRGVKTWGWGIDFLSCSSHLAHVWLVVVIAAMYVLNVIGLSSAKLARCFYCAMGQNNAKQRIGKIQMTSNSVRAAYFCRFFLHSPWQKIGPNNFAESNPPAFNNTSYDWEGCVDGVFLTICHLRFLSSFKGSHTGNP